MHSEKVGQKCKIIKIVIICLTIILLVTGYVIMFKPYIKYEKINEGRTFIRTNLFTGETEVFDSSNPRWKGYYGIRGKYGGIYG